MRRQGVTCEMEGGEEKQRQSFTALITVKQSDQRPLAFEI